MTEKRKPRSYTDEFKQQIVQLYHNGKRKCDICREYDIATCLLDKWLKQAETSGSFHEKDIRHTIGKKEIYGLRKETIERIFGTAKEQHGFRYTQYIGKVRMEMKTGITFACMNLKKLAKILAYREGKAENLHRFLCDLKKKLRKIEKWFWGLTPAPTLSTV